MPFATEAAALVADVERRIADAEARLATVVERINPLALDAISGDETAGLNLATLQAERLAVIDELALLRAAVSTARDRQRQADVARQSEASLALQAANRKKLARALRGVSEELVSYSAALDKMTKARDQVLRFNLQVSRLVETLAPLELRHDPEFRGALSLYGQRLQDALSRGWPSDWAAFIAEYTTARQQLYGMLTGEAFDPKAAIAAEVEE